MENAGLDAFRRLYEAFRAELGGPAAEACVRRALADALPDAVPAPQTPPLPPARRRRPKRGRKRELHPASRRVQTRRWLR